jgi:hypothetical protein
MRGRERGKIQGPGMAQSQNRRKAVIKLRRGEEESGEKSFQIEKTRKGKTIELRGRQKKV